MQNADSVYDRTHPWQSLPERQVSNVLALLAVNGARPWTPPKPVIKQRKTEPTIYDVLGLRGGSRG